MFHRNLVLILVTLFIGSPFFLKVNADDPETYYHKWDLNYALGVLNNKEIKLIEQWKTLDKLEIQQAMLRVQWDENTEDMAENAIALSNAVTVDVLQIVASIVATTANQIKDFSDALALASARVSKNREISYQNVHVQGKITERDAAYKHYKAHYDAYVEAYSASLDLIEKGGTPSLLGIDSGMSVPCANPKCSTTYSTDVYGLELVLWVAYKNHKKTCLGTASCGKEYWTCKGFEKVGTERHKPRTCKIKGRKWNSETSSYETVTCGMAYRNCDNPGGRCFKGKVVGNVKHNDEVSAQNSYATVSPPKSGSLSGSSSASAGGSVTIGLSTTTAFRSVYWYVAAPGASGLGSHVETDTGSSSSTTDSFTYTFPSDATSGDWTITAYIYNYSDSSTYQVSHTVSVSGSSYTASDDTPNCSDCTSHCSSPCSCSNSGTCNGSVYTPPSTPSTPPTPPPTPSTPVIVACGGAAWTGCTDPVSSRTEHKVSSCSNCGNYYWTCMSGAVERHTEVKTCKRTGCGASLTRCQNGPKACSINGGYHWL